MTSQRHDVPAETFLAAFQQLEPYVEKKYGIPVRIRDVPNPFTGDLDGAEIHVDYDVDPETGLFILTHLFGHTVQWNLSDDARRLGQTPVHPPAPESYIDSLLHYEHEAARYSLALFHEAKITGLDQWLSDFSACDLAYLGHFYRTGEKRDFFSFWISATHLLTPLPVPLFFPEKWLSRWGGVVI